MERTRHPEANFTVVSVTFEYLPTVKLGSFLLRAVKSARPRRVVGGVGQFKFLSYGYSRGRYRSRAGSRGAARVRFRELQLEARPTHRYLRNVTKPNADARAFLRRRVRLP